MNKTQDILLARVISPLPPTHFLSMVGGFFWQKL
jgi:hypothetical protein